jgi:hypothetical protein
MWVAMVAKKWVFVSFSFGKESFFRKAAIFAHIYVAENSVGRHLTTLARQTAFTLSYGVSDAVAAGAGSEKCLHNPPTGWL